MIALKITKDANLVLNWIPDATLIEGREVQNSQWSFRDNDPGYYVLTTSQGLTGEEKVSVGLSGLLNPGGISGVLTVSTLVVGSGEVKLTNNIDADKIDYFQQ